jgi:hypothetical protein
MVKLRVLKGANMDIDFSKANWEQDNCPWNLKEGSNEHKCAVKNVSICKYFKGIKKPDRVLCSYPEGK